MTLRIWGNTGGSTNLLVGGISKSVNGTSYDVTLTTGEEAGLNNTNVVVSIGGTSKTIQRVVVGQGPVISNITHNVLSASSAEIVWSVSPNATGQVEYADNAGMSGSSQTTYEGTLLAGHAQIITGFAGASLYYRITSTASGQSTTSAVQGPVSMATAAGYAFPAYLADPSTFTLPSSVGASTVNTYNGKDITIKMIYYGDRNAYSKQSAFAHPTASDVTYGILHNNQLWRSDTGTVSGTVGYVRASAANTKPGVFFGTTNTGQQLFEYNAVTQGETLLYSFAGMSGYLEFGQAEGTQSEDDDLFVISDQTGNTVNAAYRRSDNSVTYRTESQILDDAVAVWGDLSFTSVDWVSASLGGKVVARIQSGTSANRRYVLYDWPFSSRRKIGSPHLRSSHSCFFRGSNGEDCLAGVFWAGHYVVDLNDETVVYFIIHPGLDDGWMSGMVKRQGWYTSSADNGSTSLVLSVKFDKADFNMGVLDTSNNQTELGNHYRTMTSGPAVEVIGRIPNTGAYYNHNANANASKDGRYMFILNNDGTSQTTAETFVVTAQQ